MTHEYHFKDSDIERYHTAVMEALGLEPKGDFTTSQVFGPLCLVIANILSTAPTEERMDFMIGNLADNIKVMAQRLREDPVMEATVEEVQ